MKDKKNRSHSTFPPGEPPNSLREEDCTAYDPPFGPPDGEDRFPRHIADDEVFPDTGGTMGDFRRSSRQVAELLKDI